MVIFDGALFQAINFDYKLNNIMLDTIRLEMLLFGFSSNYEIKIKLAVVKQTKRMDLKCWLM